MHACQEGFPLNYTACRSAAHSGLWNLYFFKRDLALEVGRATLEKISRILVREYPSQRASARDAGVGYMGRFGFLFQHRAQHAEGA
jgi:hypothetical protein